MMQQYRELKARDPDALLLFRMGDFYELFGEDAERASALLGIALTTRDRDKGEQAVPMAGFPHPALESYLARIVQAGLRAAVCEQLEDPRLAKGLVRRNVVRIVTPGTLTDEALLDPRTSNYLAAVVDSGTKLGLAWVELSTGRFSLTGLLRHELADEMARLNAAETLVSELAVERPLVACAEGLVGTGRHDPPLVGLPARTGARPSTSSLARPRSTASASTTAPWRSRPRAPWLRI